MRGAKRGAKKRDEAGRRNPLSDHRDSISPSSSNGAHVRGRVRVQARDVAARGLPEERRARGGRVAHGPHGVAVGRHGGPVAARHGGLDPAHWQRGGGGATAGSQSTPLPSNFPSPPPPPPLPIVSDALLPRTRGTTTEGGGVVAAAGAGDPWGTRVHPFHPHVRKACRCRGRVRDCRADPGLQRPPRAACYATRAEAPPHPGLSGALRRTWM